MVSRPVPRPIGLGIDGLHLPILNSRAQSPGRADGGRVPVRQNAQSVPLDQKRISRQSVLGRIQGHHTLKNRYGSQKMIINSLSIKNIVTLVAFFKRIVWYVGGRLK